jgi:hypothetical protein
LPKTGFHFSGSCSGFLFEHDPFRKLAATFRDHALIHATVGPKTGMLDQKIATAKFL